MRLPEFFRLPVAKVSSLITLLFFFPPPAPPRRWSTCSGFLHQLLDLDWHVGSDYIHGELRSSAPDLHSNYDQTLSAVILIGFAPEF